MKTTLGIAAFVLLLASTAAAETYYVPGACEPGKASLEIQNRGDQPAAFWVQLPTVPVDEIRYDLEGRDGLTVRGKEFLALPQGFAVKTYNKTLSFRWSCAGKSYDLVTWTSPESSYAVAPGFGDLQLLNLSPQAQDVNLDVLDSSGQVLVKYPLHFEKYYETQRVQFNFPLEARELQISGQGRLHTVLLDAEGLRLPTRLRAPARLAAPDDQVYFLISTRGAGADESYVIGMQDPKMITTARQQILNPSLEKIIVAGITLGNQGVNRSFSSRDRSPYSWSVSRVDAFADFALIDCDGSPDIVEEHLMERIQSGGNICFWHYRVLRELSREEVQRGY